MPRPRKHPLETRFCLKCRTDQPFYTKPTVILGVIKLVPALPYCVECHKKTMKERGWYRTPKLSRQYHLKQQNTTVEEWEKKIEEQGGMCVCGLPGTEDNPLCFDHNHKTGKFRGAMHSNCNVAIGMVGENAMVLRNLAAYLERN